MIRVVFILLLLVSSGCALGPDYERPELTIPAAWNAKSPQAGEVSKEPWWRTWDPILTTHIESALTNNTDLLSAVSRIKQAEALYQDALTDYFPQIITDAAYTRSGRSKTNFPRFPGKTISDDYTARALLNWELDIWGKIRREDEAALARLLSADSGKQAVLISLVSGVAQTYVELRSLDRQLEIARETAGSRKKAFDLVKSKFDAGAISELELRQSEAEYLSAQVLVPSYEKFVRLKENQLSILLGKNPYQIERGKTIQELSKGFLVPMGLPSSLLENRPDVVQAEQDLIAANAEIGAAKADLFPTFTLTGLFGFQSAESKDWFKRASNIWNIAPGITLPIFTGGKGVSAIDIAEALKEQSLINYQKTLQTAFKEVEDALISYEKNSDERVLRAKQVNSLKRAFELSGISYDAGQVSYITVLDAQRLLLNAQLEETKMNAQYLQAAIEIYRALGGDLLYAAGTADVSKSNA